MVGTSPYISFDSTSLSQVDNFLKYEIEEACKDNGALQSTPMVMLGLRSLGLYFLVNKFINMDILSPSKLYTNFMHNSHLICLFPVNHVHQLYDSNVRFHDRIEAWMERFYLDIFPMNYHYEIFNMVNKVFDVLIFPIFSLLLLQVLLLIFCLEHMHA
jgi:hypothetical protein